MSETYKLLQNMKKRCYLFSLLLYMYKVKYLFQTKNSRRKIFSNELHFTCSEVDSSRANYR